MPVQAPIVRTSLTANYNLYLDEQLDMGRIADFRYNKRFVAGTIRSA